MPASRPSVCESTHQFALCSSSWRTAGTKADTGWSSFTVPGTNFERPSRSESRRLCHVVIIITSLVFETHLTLEFGHHLITSLSPTNAFPSLLFFFHCTQCVSLPLCQTATQQSRDTVRVTVDEQCLCLDESDLYFWLAVLMTVSL